MVKNYKTDRILTALRNTLIQSKESRLELKAKLRALQAHFKRGDGAKIEEIFGVLHTNACALMDARAEHNHYFLSTFGPHVKGISENAAPKAKTAGNVITTTQMPDGSELKIYRRGGFLFDAEIAEKLALSLAQVARDLKAAEAAHKDAKVRALVEIHSKED